MIIFTITNKMNMEKNTNLPKKLVTIYRKNKERWVGSNLIVCSDRVKTFIDFRVLEFVFQFKKL